MSSKYLDLQKILASHQKVAVAFSGGVDSSFLVYAACATLGPSSVHVFHARSELLPSFESREAERIIQERGCFFHPVDFKPLSWLEFVANGTDRCYLCKKKIYQTFLADPCFPAGAFLLDGTNLDDLGQDRPGLRAVAELKVQTPLAAVGLSKKEIRLLSRDFALPTWNTPSSSCLGTRIAHGEPITRKKILLVARCEALLNTAGFMGVRVRFSSDETATIVVLWKDLEKIQENRVISAIKNVFLSLGISEVVVDQQGREDWRVDFSSGGS